MEITLIPSYALWIFQEYRNSPPPHPPQNTKDTPQPKEHTALTIKLQKNSIEQEHFFVNSCTNIFHLRLFKHSSQNIWVKLGLLW